ncbi:MAG: PilZ domain-containing protein [Treponema sp.]|nr:PilZ domain-containing protein [Treponema sp.]
MENNRKYERFEDFGRIECFDICPFPGTLNDISQTGMKVTFNSFVTIEMEEEYKVTVRIPKCYFSAIELVVTPVWAYEHNGTYQIGFSILHSAGATYLAEYLRNLQHEKEAELEDTEIFA